MDVFEIWPCNASCHLGSRCLISCYSAQPAWSWYNGRYRMWSIYKDRMLKSQVNFALSCSMCDVWCVLHYRVAWGVEPIQSWHIWIFSDTWRCPLPISIGCNKVLKNQVIPGPKGSPVGQITSQQRPRKNMLKQVNFVATWSSNMQISKLVLCIYFCVGVWPILDYVGEVIASQHRIRGKNEGAGFTCVVVSL